MKTSKQNLFNLNDSINEEEDESIEELEENEEEKNNDYCSMDEHKEIKALIYCQECQRNMCKSCEQYHSNFLKGHHTYSLDKNKNEIFTGLCTNKMHSLELEFYCKTHNQLCCAACISKIKSNGKGQHKNCEVYCLTKIKLIKKENLEENINHLEELSNKLEPTIKELNSIFDKINESKEKIKTDINILFNKLRNELNNREKQLYKEIDEKFGEIFFKDGFIKESKTLPNLVKISLEKGMIKEDDWNNKKNLSELIHTCINIENSIKNINEIYDKIEKFNSNKDFKLEFFLENKDIEQNLLNDIKNLGGIKVEENNKK